MEKTDELFTLEQEQKTEVAPGMTVEEIKALYFDNAALREPQYRIYQLNTEGHRYYYRWDESQELKFYPSVTTMLKQVMPTSPQLIDWMLKNGADGAAEKRDLAAAYGTFMHIQFETLIINRRYDFDKVPEVLRNYMEQENLPDKFFNENVTKIRKDVLAFAQFVKDYNVRPLAVEIGLVHPEYNFAGTVDLPCIMTDPKTKEQFAAIVDFKSGRKGFWEEHELQLHLYRMMWNVNFPDAPIERLFNFSPKDWRTDKPTYNLKEQTNSVNARKLPHLLALAGIEDEKRDNTITVVEGVLDLDEGKIGDNVKQLSLSELIKSRKTETETPADAVTEPEKESPENRTETAQIRENAPKPINTTTKEQKPEKTQKTEKLADDIDKLPFDNESNLLSQEIEL